MKQTMRDFVIPTLVLTVICLVISAALSLTNSFADPVIKENDRRATQEAIKEVLPEGDTFDESGAALPADVTNLYTAKNGAGTAVRLRVSGYGGKITMMVGVAKDQTIAGIKILEQSETQGLGSRVMDGSYTGRFVGKSGPDEVDSIAGSTISSKALKKGVQIALDAAKEG